MSVGRYQDLNDLDKLLACIKNLNDDTFLNSHDSEENIACAIKLISKLVEKNSDLVFKKALYQKLSGTMMHCENISPFEYALLQPDNTTLILLIDILHKRDDISINVKLKETFEALETRAIKYFDTELFCNSSRAVLRAGAGNCSNTEEQFRIAEPIKKGFTTLMAIKKMQFEAITKSKAKDFPETKESASQPVPPQNSLLSGISTLFGLFAEKTVDTFPADYKQWRDNIEHLISGSPIVDSTLAFQQKNF